MPRIQSILGFFPKVNREAVIAVIVQSTKLPEAVVRKVVWTGAGEVVGRLSEMLGCLRGLVFPLHARSVGYVAI